VSTHIGGLLTELVSPGAAALSAASGAAVAHGGNGRVGLAAGQSIAFSGWLDALPLGYWRRFTSVQTVRLEVTSSAPVDVTVRVSDSRGICRDLISGTTSAGVFTATVNTSETPDGGWAWPVLTAPNGAGAAAVAEVGWRWVTDDILTQPSSLAVAITTFNRQEACLRQLGALAAAAREGGALDGVLGRVIVVDQGTDAVADSAGFAAIQDSLGECLTVIRQQNLGGSGGFTRGLYEGLKDSRITHVALLDDATCSTPRRRRASTGSARRWTTPGSPGPRCLVLP
jgi:galactofuranosylgalactofuranosylrhamnosyl-N-acetylglucosaminyl-diphospho-decaprenol beta-1,5/1,6-galactofuranosyltransferase